MFPVTEPTGVPRLHNATRAQRLDGDHNSHCLLSFEFCWMFQDKHVIKCNSHVIHISMWIVAKSYILSLRTVHLMVAFLQTVGLESFLGSYPVLPGPPLSPPPRAPSPPTSGWVGSGLQPGSGTQQHHLLVRAGKDWVAWGKAWSPWPPDLKNFGLPEYRMHT